MVSRFGRTLAFTVGSLQLLLAAGLSYVSVLILSRLAAADPAFPGGSSWMGASVVSVLAAMTGLALLGVGGRLNPVVTTLVADLLVVLAAAISSGTGARASGAIPLAANGYALLIGSFPNVFGVAISAAVGVFQIYILWQARRWNPRFAPLIRFSLRLGNPLQS